MGEDFDDDITANPHAGPSIGVLISRRMALRGLAGAGALSALGMTAARATGPSSFTFREVPHGLDTTHHVPEGYELQVLMRWGDPVLPGAPAHDPLQQKAAAQALQFGYNNDFLGLHALPRGDTTGERFLLVVNHEYTNSNLMFAGLGEGRLARLKATREHVEIEMAAHGGSVLEIVREGRRWKVVEGSRYARRIDANTPMRIAGPAAGHGRMKTSADREGRTVLGMVNNCAGGETPWGTWLTCEENFNNYFVGDASKYGDEMLGRRYALGRLGYAWGGHVDRFNFDIEPHEPNRFGWIVEIDPYDPHSTPVKRTALGRMAHEGCHHAVARDGRVVFYMGDDARFEYIYKFVTSRPWNPDDRGANRDLLDEGTLYAARFDEGGAIRWLPLVHGQEPLTAGNGFHDQGDVVINARRAADLVKATPMDRPEDMEANRVNGRVYVALSNNGARTPDRVDAANPRARNDHGHIIEITPRDGDHAALDAYADRLARGLAVIVDILDPDVIVLGGGMSNIARLYEVLPAAVAPHVFSDVFDTPVRPAAHGDSSGVRGAAWLWPLE